MLDDLFSHSLVISHLVIVSHYMIVTHPVWSVQCHLLTCLESLPVCCHYADGIHGMVGQSVVSASLYMCLYVFLFLL